MAIDLFLNKTQPVEISFISLDQFDEIKFDACLEENHKVTVEATDFPIEGGANASDHKAKKPDSLRITAVISNTPIQFLAAFLNPTLPGGETPDVEGWRRLKEMSGGEELLTVVTTLETYEDMYISAMSAPRTAALGNTLEVTIDLKKMFTVASATVVAPVVKSGTGANKSDLGSKASKNASEGKKSFLRKHTGSLAERIGEFFR